LLFCFQSHLNIALTRKQFTKRAQDNTVSVVIRLRPDEQRNLFRFPSRSMRFVLFLERPGQQQPIRWVVGKCSPEVRRPIMKMTIQLHQVHRLMSTDIPPRPHTPSWHVRGQLYPLQIIIILVPSFCTSIFTSKLTPHYSDICVYIAYTPT